MNSGNFTSSLNTGFNNKIEKKTYHKAGTANSIALLFFVGTTMLKCHTSREYVSEYYPLEPSYIQYINLEQEKRFFDLDSNRVIDLMRIENLNKLKKMALFTENWNGTGGSAFSPNAISFFEAIIEMLDKQPEIAPTGRNSLLMQYELDDQSLLAFEVNERSAEKVYIPKGNYSKAEVETFTKNIAQKIKESVEDFYGYR